MSRPSTPQAAPCRMCGDLHADVRIEGTALWNCCEPATTHRFGYRVLLCKRCGHVFGQWDHDLTHLYQQEEYVTCDTDLEHYSAFVTFVLGGMTPVAGKPTILDIGCNRGALLKRFYDLGFACHGVEAGARNAAAARALMPAATITCGYFDEHLAHRLTAHAPDPTRGPANRPPGDASDPASATASAFDVVMMTSVLEHLPDPRRTIELLRPLVRPTGRLFLVVPDLEAYGPTHPIPEHLTPRYGCSPFSLFYRNPFLCYGQHINHFSRTGLTRHLDRLGFETTHAAPMNGFLWLLAKPAAAPPVHSDALDCPDIVAFHADLMTGYDSSLRALRESVRSTLAGRRVVCYGAGRELRHFVDVFRPLGVDPIAVADDARPDPLVAGIPVVRPNALAELDPDVCVVTSFRFEQAIAEKARRALTAGTSTGKLAEVVTLTDLLMRAEQNTPAHSATDAPARANQIECAPTARSSALSLPA